LNQFDIWTATSTVQFLWSQSQVFLSFEVTNTQIFFKKKKKKRKKGKKKKMRTSRFAGIVVVAAAAVAPIAVFAEGSAQLNIRGLNPELEPIYAAASTAGELSCGDGTGKTVPFSAINDEFCDCPGTNADEPGTSACAGLSVHNFPGIAGTPATAHQHGDGAPDARGGSGGASAPVVFHCRNRGHHALSLPPSRVDDGHCDCCDGSDEPLARACGDSCRALGADTVRRLREELTNAEAALAIREQRIVEGRAEANARVEERTEAERALAEATSARAVMHERVMVAEEAESAERERRQKASDDEFQAQQQQQQQQQQQEQQAAEAAAAASEATAAAEGSGVAEAEAEAEKPAAPEPPKIEYSDPGMCDGL
jgi:protein kinase C substrate 80K-H